MRVLVLGISGMLGHTVFRVLSENTQLDVYGSLRNQELTKMFDPKLHSKIIPFLDVLNQKLLSDTIIDLKPEVVINCIGVVKQYVDSKDPLVALPLNSMLPHQLLKFCTPINARVIHISTDCVFSGKKGNYVESDISDAEDLYGRSKYIGELNDFKNAITIRTSIIGHELSTHKSLIDWFLSKNSSVKGFRRAIFSGLPTIELAYIIDKYVLPNKNLYGLYHVSAKPINKFELLSLVAKVYKKNIQIVADDELKIDRSLNSDRFTSETGYTVPDWSILIKKMYDNRDSKVK